jgi:glucosylceramidase
MKTYFNAGANSYMYWNLVLNETGKSHWGWKQNSLITIDRTKKRVFYNPEYFLFKHFSYFIEPGSTKVLTKGKFKDILAFVTPSNDLIIVVTNNSLMPKLLRIKVAKKMIQTVVPKNSFNTFVYLNAV